MALPTVIPTFTEPEWAEKFLKTFPEPWTSVEARQPGGVLYALMFALGQALAAQLENVRYDWKACRIETAVDDALDLIASDFFGTVAGFPADVIRAPGEPDNSLRARIKATLLLPAATRQSLINLLVRLTNQTPRVMEPWSPGDTSVWDIQSFFDIDTVENSARLGDPGLTHQGFVESALPSFGNQGDYPIWCFDKGAAWDSPSAYFFEAQATWWLQVARIDALINKTKPFGTIVWRKYTGQPLTRGTLGGTLSLEAGTTSYLIEVYPAFAGAFMVLANCNWNTSVSFVPSGTNQFLMTFSSPVPPGGGSVDWLATPLSVPGVGSGPVALEANSATIGILSQFQSKIMMVQPNWNTTAWLHSRSSNQAVLKFGTSAPLSASIAYQYFEPDFSGQVTVPANAGQYVISISTRDPFQAFVLPTWNTTVDIDKSTTGLLLTFSNPPPSDAYLYWAIHES